MSFWSDLYAGDVERIAHAFREGEDVDAGAVVEHVNLPGILPEGDASMELLGELVEAPFQDGIADRVVDDEESGVFLMSADWARRMAAIADPGVVARDFLARGDPGAENDAVQVETIRALIGGIARVCRVATERGLAVVYTWTL